MKKELSPSLEMVACDVCGRTILKGERTEPYLVPDGSRRLVCDLCIRRAEGAGWLRESVHGDMPAAVPRAEPRRSLLGRLRGRFEERPASPGLEQTTIPGDAYEAEVWERDQPSDRHHEPVDRPPRYRPEEDAFDGGPASSHPDEPEAADVGHAPPDEPEAADVGPAPPDEPLPVDAAMPPAEDPSAADDVVLGAEEAPAAPEAGPSSEPVPPEANPGAVESFPPLAELPPEGPQLEESLLRDAAQEDLPLEGEEPADLRAERRERRHRRRLRDPRHVRAVPTGAEAKVERALEIFNLSDYRRTVSGLVRTLGPPWVTALPHADSTSEVTVVVAWELSWYQFRVDLGDSHEPVAVADKGHEVDEIDEELRRWNATATEDGALEPGAPA